jgi:hypothetical protein
MYLGADIGFGISPAMVFAVLLGAAFGALPITLATWMFYATPDIQRQARFCWLSSFSLLLPLVAPWVGW